MQIKFAHREACDFEKSCDWRKMMSRKNLSRLFAKTRFAVAAIAALALSACVESEAPLLADAKPLLGQQFEVHLYENFVDKKANDFHSAIYHWADGRYTRASGLARDVKSFSAQPLDGNDFLIQSANDSGKLFNYWIGRRLIEGVYLIFPLNEEDVDEAKRDALCGKNRLTGFCRITTAGQLVTLARATAGKPVRVSALGVILNR
jgi:hypothetical protein